MSTWYKAVKKDIEIDREEKEVNILVTADDYGNIYLFLTFDQIKDIYKKIQEEQ